MLISGPGTSGFEFASVSFPTVITAAPGRSFLRVAGGGRRGVRWRSGSPARL